MEQSDKIKYFVTSDIEDNAMSCLKLLEEDKQVEKVAVFSDIHYCSEKAVPVGVAFKTSNVFYPLITGKDMGCGVAYLRFPKSKLLKPFDKAKHYKAFEREVHSATDEGLGGGNHFLSLEESNEYFYIIIHTGSRNLGIQMYQENYALIQDNNPGHNWLPIEFATKEYRDKYQFILDYAEQRRNQFLQKIYLFLLKNKYLKDYLTYEEGDSCHNLLEFKMNEVIHRKGSTELVYNPVVIPLSMSRGSLIVKPNIYHPSLEDSLFSSSHGAGRKLSRTDTLIHWYQFKKAKKEEYKKQFPEFVDQWGNIDSSVLQEFDFAYKDSDSILSDQPHLIKVDETKPIATVKFTGV